MFLYDSICQILATSVTCVAWLVLTCYLFVVVIVVVIVVLLVYFVWFMFVWVFLGVSKHKIGLCGSFRFNLGRKSIVLHNLQRSNISSKKNRQHFRNFTLRRCICTSIGFYASLRLHLLIFTLFFVFIFFFFSLLFFFLFITYNKYI